MVHQNRFLVLCASLTGPSSPQSGGRNALDEAVASGLSLPKIDTVLFTFQRRASCCRHPRWRGSHAQSPRRSLPTVRSYQAAVKFVDQYKKRSEYCWVRSSAIEHRCGPKTLRMRMRWRAYLRNGTRFVLLTQAVHTTTPKSSLELIWHHRCYCRRHLVSRGHSLCRAAPL